MNGRNYYNEFDPQTAAWLRELIRAGLIADGDVDARSIVEVQPQDLAGYRQCHFFAGVGGWSYALRLAGVRDGAPVWTGSCPCQPFSCAGKGLGTKDPRHLWPEFRRLIAECRPATVFGEQVASDAGRDWLAGVRTDMEGMDYAVGAADLCAAGVGAPHRRQRLWWVGHTRKNGCGNGLQMRRSAAAQPGERGLLKYKGPGSPWWPAEAILCRDSKARRIKPGLAPLADGVPARVVRLRGYGNAIVPQVAAVFIRAALADLT